MSWCVVMSWPVGKRQAMRLVVPGRTRWWVHVGLNVQRRRFWKTRRIAARIASQIKRSRLMKVKVMTTGQLDKLRIERMLVRR